MRVWSRITLCCIGFSEKFQSIMSVKNGIKLFEYLEKLSLLNVSVKSNVRKLSSDEDLFDLEDLNFLPVLDKIFLKNRDVAADKEEGLLLSIERYAIEKMPKLPRELERWVNIEAVDFIKPEPSSHIIISEKFDEEKERVDAFDQITKEWVDVPEVINGWVSRDDAGEYQKIQERDVKIYFSDYPELQQLFDDWLANKWEEWRERNSDYFKANQAFDKFYALRSFLKTESDSFDLLWGHDVIAWEKGGVEIYHPTFFTPIKLEFDPERNFITVRKDENSKTFFDVAFIRESLDENSTNLPDIDELAERINSSDDLNIWDYELINKYLQQLVHYVSPEGESKYSDRNEKTTIGTHPIAFNHHHIFLLKKTGKSWADYSKKIQEDIRKNDALTPFLDDLVSEGDVAKIAEDDSGAVDVDGSLENAELYFPLPYNDEQKRISEQIDYSYGSVVQGPPGTGKTHTIANLISRFLAKGKTVLVTSQTGQALSVLKNKIPKGIRPLVVSQVESDSKGGNLQSSVSEINTNLSDSIKFTEDKYKKKALELKEIRENIALKNNEFEKKSLIDSREDITIGIEKIKPVEAAKIVSVFANCDKFKMLDSVDYRDEQVIQQSLVDKYISLLQSVDAETWEYASLDEVPSIDELPELSDIEDFFEIKSGLKKEELKLVNTYIPSTEDLEVVGSLRGYIKDYLYHLDKTIDFKKGLEGASIIVTDDVVGEVMEALTEDGVVTIIELLLSARQSLGSFNEEWEKELANSVKNKNEKNRWLEILATIDDRLVKYRLCDKKGIGNLIDINEEYKAEYLVTLDTIEKIRQRALENGQKIKKGVILYFDSNVRRFINAVRINNKEIGSLEELDVVEAHFLKIKLIIELENLWSQGFVNIQNIKEFDRPFRLISFEADVENSKRIVEYEERHQKIKEAVLLSGIVVDFDIFNSDSIDSARSEFDNILSFYKLKEYSNIFSNIKNTLRGDNMHEVTLRLHRKIDERDMAEIERLEGEIRELNKRRVLSEKYFMLEQVVFNAKVRELKENKKNHRAVTEYLQNLSLGDVDKIKLFYTGASKLIDSQNRSKDLMVIEKGLEEKMPKTVNAIKSKIKDEGLLDIDIIDNWRWQRLVNWLDFLHKGDDLSKVSKDLQILKNQEMRIVGELVEISAWMHLKDRTTKSQKEALASFALSMKKYGKGTGKYSHKHLKDAKNALEVGKNAVPVWIMPVNTIHQLFPNPTAGMFDVVIFDEASQVDTRGLNIAYIGKKLLVVGDDEQVSPTTFTTESKVTDLITRYISDIPNSHHFSYTSSLFDIAKIKMTDIITLTEHFRSIDEMIGFSNALSYQGNLKVLRNQMPKYRLDPVLEPIFIENGFEATNGKVNEPEAERVVDKLLSMLADEKYKETKEDGETRPVTFGIISLLGKDQSKHITKLISEKVSSKEIEKRNIVCGDPYVFQGDERDVIFLSMVKAPDIHNPDKAITSYTIATKAYKQRVNVAMSRAKNKMVLFHSISKDKLSNPDDLRKKIIDWFYSNKTAEQKSGLDRVREEVEKGTASEFEYEVAKLIINKGYKVIPQYEVAGYRIDLVIQGENSRLAIECDGDKYHNSFEKWHEDIERQQILERAGWKFWRLSGSAFYRHKEVALDSLWVMLEEMKIMSSI